MIPPEFYDVNLSLLSVHKELQEEILRDIVRRLQKTDFSLTLTAEWQTEKLLQTGKLYEEILSEIAKRTGKQKAEIARVFENAEIEMTERAEALCTATGEKIENLSPALHKTIRAALSKTATEAANLTKTTAVTAQTAYIFAADIAHQKVVSGAFSYDEAIRSAVLSAAGKDLTVVYPSGHVDSLDVAVRRAVLTGTNGTAGKIADTVGEELELDLREITAHAGARPEHAVWQGKIVSMSGRKGYLSPADIGYGDVRGFMGANCRHNWYPYIEGTPRSYTDAELAEMARETVTVDGEEMPLYEAIQKQRGYERAVRKTKRELVALDELSKNEKDPIKLSADKAEFSARSVKLKAQEARLADFCKKAGLDRDRTREQVFAEKTENGIRNFGKSVSGKAVWSAKKHYETFKKEYNAENLPKTLDKYYDMKYNDPPTHKALKAYTHMVDKGEVSSFLGFDQFEKVAKELDALSGIKTVSGIEIKGYSDHCVGRVIGQAGLSKEYNREGVPVEVVRKCLTEGKQGKMQTASNGDVSVLFALDGNKVSVNPDSGIIVQVNGKVW